MRKAVKPIFLIGYMGCGKTTLGEALACLMHIEFIDLDDYIERQCGASIGSIFATQGEAAFRTIEQECLRQVARLSNVVVACGGGTPCAPGCMDLMNRCGRTVWLNASLARIVDRLDLPEQKAKRPKIAGRNRDEIVTIASQGLGERKPFYSQAQLEFDSTYLESALQVRDSARQLASLLAGEDMP